MNITPTRGSLVWTLALAYLGLALVAAIAVRLLSLSFELSELDRDLQRGWLAQATAEAAAQLSADHPAGLGGDAGGDGRRLSADLRAAQAALYNQGHRGVLTELGAPIGMAVQAPDGRVLARIGDIVLPAAPPAAASGTATRTPSANPHEWRYSAPLRDRAGRLTGRLDVGLVRRPPGLRALIGDEFEWPALIVYAVVFGLGSALVLQLAVTRRLQAIARTADAWSEGDFSLAIADASTDEIGKLAGRLDQMARQLEALVELRGEVAGLNERQRLARDLHDTVKQKAFALQLQLAAVRRTPALDADVAARLEDARGIVREIQEELAHLIGDTAPASVEAFDQVLAERAEAWGRRGGFSVRAQLDAALDVPAEQRPVVARVLDEALANVMRHSGALEADIRLSAAAGRFELVVEDDGRGLRRAREGMGLRNMRRRAADLPGGALEVGAGTYGGVRVTLTWTRPIMAGT